MSPLEVQPQLTQLRGARTIYRARTILRFRPALKSIRAGAGLEIEEAQPRNSKVITQAFAQEIVARLFAGRLVHVTLVRLYLRIDIRKDRGEFTFLYDRANRVVEQTIDPR